MTITCHNSFWRKHVHGSPSPPNKISNALGAAHEEHQHQHTQNQLCTALEAETLSRLLRSAIPCHLITGCSRSRKFGGENGYPGGIKCERCQAWALIIYHIQRAESARGKKVRRCGELQGRRVFCDEIRAKLLTPAASSTPTLPWMIFFIWDFVSAGFISACCSAAISTHRGDRIYYTAHWNQSRNMQIFIQGRERERSKKWKNVIISSHSVGACPHKLYKL